jgi:hypothetical protein
MDGTVNRLHENNFTSSKITNIWGDRGKNGIVDNY